MWLLLVPLTILAYESEEVELGLIRGQEFDDGEDGFVMSKPLLEVILEEEMDKGLGLEVGLKGEGGEGVEGVEGVLEARPRWVLA